MLFHKGEKFHHNGLWSTRDKHLWKERWTSRISRSCTNMSQSVLNLSYYSQNESTEKFTKETTKLINYKSAYQTNIHKYTNVGVAVFYILDWRQNKKFGALCSKTWKYFLWVVLCAGTCWWHHERKYFCTKSRPIEAACFHCPTVNVKVPELRATEQDHKHFKCPKLCPKQ